MPRFITVDRLGKLKEDLSLVLVRHGDMDPALLQAHVDTLFPDGVSEHGNRFFLSNGSQAQVTSPQIELLFEYARRARYPDRPSRFTSFFGVETLEAAREFSASHGQNRGSIWEVEADKWFRADMNLLRRGTTNLVFSYYSELYWSGEGSDRPFWEVLLVPPVRVLRKVEGPPEG